MDARTWLVAGLVVLGACAGDDLAPATTEGPPVFLDAGSGPLIEAVRWTCRCDSFSDSILRARWNAGDYAADVTNDRRVFDDPTGYYCALGTDYAVAASESACNLRYGTTTSRRYCACTCCPSGDSCHTRHDDCADPDYSCSAPLHRSCSPAPESGSAPVCPPSDCFPGAPCPDPPPACNP